MSAPRFGPEGQAAGHSLAAAISETQDALGDFARRPIASRRQAAMLARAALVGGFAAEMLAADADNQGLADAERLTALQRSALASALALVCDECQRIADELLDAADGQTAAHTALHAATPPPGGLHS